MIMIENLPNKPTDLKVASILFDVTSGRVLKRICCTVRLSYSSLERWWFPKAPFGLSGATCRSNIILNLIMCRNGGKQWYMSKAAHILCTLNTTMHSIVRIKKPKCCCTEQLESWFHSSLQSKATFRSYPGYHIFDLGLACLCWVPDKLSIFFYMFYCL